MTTLKNTISINIYYLILYMGKWEIRYGGHTADIWRICGGHMANIRRTYGEHTANLRQKLPRTYGGHTANIRQYVSFPSFESADHSPYIRRMSAVYSPYVRRMSTIPNLPLRLIYIYYTYFIFYALAQHKFNTNYGIKAVIMHISSVSFSNIILASRG